MTAEIAISRMTMSSRIFRYARCYLPEKSIQWSGQIKALLSMMTKSLDVEVSMTKCLDDEVTGIQGVEVSMTKCLDDEVTGIHLNLALTLTPTLNPNQKKGKYYRYFAS